MNINDIFFEAESWVKSPLDDPNFKNWFGNSVVKDSHGNPLKVYHGTFGNFDQFSNKESSTGMIFFSVSPEFASGYASTSSAAGGKVLPCYLRIEKLYDFRDKKCQSIASNFHSYKYGKFGSWTCEQIRIGLYGKADVEDHDNPDIHDGPLTENEWMTAIKQGEYAALECDMFIDWIRNRLKYDGMVLIENNALNYAVFSRNQIKSAVSNSGNFNRRSPKINEETLMESPSTSAAIERIAYEVILALYKKSLKTVPENYERYCKGRDLDIELSDFPGVMLSDVFPDRKSVNKFPDSIKQFIKEMATLRIYPGDDKSNKLGSYSPAVSFSRQPEIYFTIKSGDGLKLINQALKNDHLTHAMIYDLLSSAKSTIIHELTHAYDDWVSKGKYRINVRSKVAQDSRRSVYGKEKSQDEIEKSFKLYQNDPIEINARYAQTLAKLRNKFDSGDSWRIVLRTFKYEFDGWNFIPEDERKRLITRFATEWTHNARPKLRDFSADVASLKQKISSLFDGVYLSYSDHSRSINISSFGTKDKTKIDMILKLIIRFADIRKLMVSTDELKLTPELKALGFVWNRNSKKRYDLPLCTIIYRNIRATVKQ